MARPFHSEAQIEENRRRLCTAALALYRDQGYDAVTLRELGAVSGVSHATPYRYFASKDELFAQVRALVFTAFGEHLQARDTRRGDPLSRLRRIVLGFVDFAAQWPEDYRLIFSMRQPPTPKGSPLAEARRRTIEHVTGVCQEAIDAGLIRGDASTQVHLAWASLHGLLSLHVSNHLVHGRQLQDLVAPMIDRLFAPVAVADGRRPQLPARTRTPLRSRIRTKK